MKLNLFTNLYDATTHKSIEYFNFFSIFSIETPSGKYDLTPAMVQIKSSEKTLHVEEFTPSVIEPSFGVGRIMYAILEHSFRQREGDEQRTVIK